MKKTKILYTTFFFFILPFLVLSKNEKTANNKNNIVILSASNYKKEISDGIIIVDYWAAWCGPCRKLDPILKEAISVTGVKLGKLNVDNNKNLAALAGVSRLPTMIIYKNGEEVKRLVGLYSKDELIEIINALK